jgi:hypothetical protein
VTGRAHRRELYRHYESGAAHEPAAEIREQAVVEGLGDVAAHQRVAARECEASRHHFQVAQESDRQNVE